MSKCKINCFSHMFDHREWEITSDGKVWPCCVYANLWDLRGDEDAPLSIEKDDPKLAKLMKDDPDWNNLEKHSLEEIVNHEIYLSHFYFEGWEGDNPSGVCVEECGEYLDDVTGKTTQKSRLE